MNQTEFMKKLASSYSLYEAAKWLSKARSEFKNKNAAELLKLHRVDEVHQVLLQDLQKNEKSK